MLLKICEMTRWSRNNSPLMNTPGSLNSPEVNRLRSLDSPVVNTPESLNFPLVHTPGSLDSWSTWYQHQSWWTKTSMVTHIAGSQLYCVFITEESWLHEVFGTSKCFFSSKQILVDSPLYSLPRNRDFPVMNTPVSHDSTVVNTPGGLYSPVRWGLHRGVNYEYGKLHENSTKF